MSRNSYIADILPVANTQLGPGSLASLLGSELEGRDDTIWIHPKRISMKQFSLMKITGGGNYTGFAECCEKRSEGKYMVGCPDLIEGLDVLASLKGPDNVLVDLILEPERTLEQLAEINKVYFDVFDRIYDIINMEGEMAFCYFSLWAPGKVSKLQVDLSIMISEEDFRHFCLPFLEEQTRQIDYTLYHLDGVDAIRHLDAVLELKELNGVQWAPGYGQPQGGNSRWYDLYKRVLAAGKSVMINWVTLDELEPLIDHGQSDCILMWF